MPPKRKNPTTITQADSSTDIEVDTNKTQPKRSRPVRSTKAVVSYDERKDDSTKSSKVKKARTTKQTSKSDKPLTPNSPKPGPSWRMTKDLVDETSKNMPKKRTNPKSKKAVGKNLENGDVEKENERPPVEPTVKTLKNKTETEWGTLDFSCHKKNTFGVTHNLIISSWNLGGLKSWVKKGGMQYLKHEHPDILCMQETKCTQKNLPKELTQLKDYHQYWCSGDKEGYAGVGLLSVLKPKSVTYGICNADQDVEGRCITAEYEPFFLVNVYVPNAGRKLITMPKRLEWNKAFKKYVNELKKKKSVIICGDMNVSHNAIDLARPQNNTKNAGFTDEEREGMTELLNDGFVDVYRHLYPRQKDVYSFWTYMANSRAKNVGWRLDYFITSKDAMKGVCDVAYRTEVFGSDHCPVTLFINI